MKPFDLEAFKNGSPAITRRGSIAKFIAYDPEFKLSHQLMVKVGGETNSVEYHADGTYIEGKQSQFDLIRMAPVIQERSKWINVYEDAMKDTTHMTKEIADSLAQPGRVDCVQITFKAEL